KKPVDVLGGAERFLTHLSTDKPIYRAGEKVYVRGVVLRADNHVPLTTADPATVEIRGPKGDVVTSGTSQTQDGVVGFAWEVPAGQAGGEYTVKISHPWAGHAPAERKFDIRAYRAPRLKSQIVFVRDGYGPGDPVTASLHVERAEGGVPSGAKVSASARVDGAEVWHGPATVDVAGNCSVSFNLPKEIARGEGTLAMVIEDGGAVETAAKTIPILLQTVDLHMYPEGGDLVAGLPNRVYVEARTPAQKPADIAGVVVDEKGEQVVTFRTEHEGRGRFSIFPRGDGKYSLKITEPAGIKTTYPLPAAKPAGAVIFALKDVTAANQPVCLRVKGTGPENLRVTLSKREVEVASARVLPMPTPKAGDNIAELEAAWYLVELKAPATADGVLVATVWDENGTPLAERLIFRQPAKSVKVLVIPDGSQYAPAEKVTLRVKTADDDGKPIGAVVGLTVTDDSVLEMIEKREQAPRLPVMVLLEDDVRELADAQVYLDGTNAKAPLAVDLLLGTQGWRRFAFVDPAKFLAQGGDAARRVVALRHPQPPMPLVMNGGAWGGAVPAPMAIEDRALNLNREDRKNAPVDAPAKLPPHPAKPEQAKEAKPEAVQQMMAKRDDFVAGKRAARPGWANSVVVREYAHAVLPNRPDNARVDFAETLYWNAGVKTDAATGEASVSFHLSDSVTTFRAFADAFDRNGALGSATAAVESVEPFYVEPKLPLEVTTGDTVELPIGIVNGMTRELQRVKITANAGSGVTIGDVNDWFTLKGRERVRRVLPMQIVSGNGKANFVLNASAGPFSDRVTRSLGVRPLGFPMEDAHGGLLEASSAASNAFTIPQSIVKDSVTAGVTIFPTPLANLTEALERLIQEPNGCFEQTSSTSYPLVMAQQYFLTHQGVDPKLVERARTNLDNAYQKLSGFECKQRGYEWFGGDPGHEALTAYGLMQFVDMTQVRQVDQPMIERTRKWLLDRRDGKGGFKRNERALDSFGGAPQATTDAYVVWALLEAGEKGLEPEIAAVRSTAMETKDSYVMALGANILMLASDPAGAKRLMDKLVKNQTTSGSVEGAVTSITRSGGEALTIETTALALLAWMRDPAYTPQVENSLKWLAESCKGGRFGSTQSTILALRAIINYDKSRARPKAPGAITLLVDGKPVGAPQEFGVDTKGAIAMPDISDLLTPGKHTIALRMDKGSAMPFAMTVKYYDVQPDTSEKCPLSIAVALRNTTVQEGNVTEAAVTVTNRTGQVLPTPIAIVGIPGGLEVRHDQLKELVKSGTIDAYEVRGREVVVYWRALKANQKVELPLSLIAAIPGTYTGPASRTYLYYTDEYKQWAPGVKVKIAAK
ncbi:MAG: MG2 domain-containing protein, partial [Tepidisphaerales bacterium]